LRRERAPAAGAGRLAALAVAAGFGLGWPLVAAAQAWWAAPPPGYPYERRVGPPGAPPYPPPDGRRRYAHPAYGKWWPGQVLPPEASVVLITDYSRYHLRVPPRGYVWLLCEGDLVLASMGTRQIFEVIPYGSY
jgi:Ni/Co efflux regulator RcnB